MSKKHALSVFITCMIFILASCDDNSGPSTVTIISVTPSNGATNVSAGTTITIVFSTSMNHSSAEGAFSINPAVTGTFSWSGNSMIFTPSGTLTYNTLYTVTISANAESSDGDNLDAPYTFSFTIELKPYPNVAGIWDWVEELESNGCEHVYHYEAIIVVTQNADGTGTWTQYGSSDPNMTCPFMSGEYTMDRDGNITINETNILADPGECSGSNPLRATVDFTANLHGTSTTMTGEVTEKWKAPTFGIDCEKKGDVVATKRP